MYRKKGQERITGIQLGNYIAKFNPCFEKKAKEWNIKEQKLKKENRKKEKKKKKEKN